MLVRAPTESVEPEKLSSTSHVIEDTELSLFRLFERIKRRRGLFTLTVLGTVLIGVAYLLFAPAQYTARAEMLIDSNTARGIAGQSVFDLSSDAPYVDTQVEILQSENVALAVIDKLKILDDDTFLAPIGFRAITHAITSMFASKEPVSSEEKLRSTVRTFLDRLKVIRVGRTYAFTIEFTATDREKAANAANAIVDLYVVDQLNAKFNATQRASFWLRDRLKDLSTQANQADKTVVEFKNSHNILQSGGNGQLMNEQQLSEINTQLVTARAMTAEAKARLDRIQTIVNSPDPAAADSSVTDALNNTVIVQLRNQYLELAKREADWAVRLGPSHLSVINIRNDMREIRKSIRDELQRIAESYKSDYDIAKSRQQSIELSLGMAVSASQSTNQAQVDLRELESTAQSYRTIYDNFLQMQLQASQQASFPLTEARSITLASPPFLKSNVSPFVLLAASGLLGTLFGAGLVTIRDLGDQTLRSADDVEVNFGVPCIGSTPLLDTPSTTSVDRSIRNPFMRESVREPMGRMAECIRELKVAVDLDSDGQKRRVIGFVSSLPREGKTTLASNFAELLAHSGLKVILIDGDMRKPALTTSVFGSGKRNGLIEILEGRAAIDDVAILREDTGLKIVPVYRDRARAHTSELLSSGAMRVLLQKLKSEYDYVVVDLPPIMPVTDSRAAASSFDALIFVAEWGKTRKAVIRSALNMSSLIRERTVGVVLSKVNMKVASRYEHYHYYGQYAGYYTT